MQFINEIGTIKCIRTQYSSSGDEKESIIATFHEHVDSVPPHVSALLSSEEIKQLETWLVNRVKLKDKLDQQPLETTMLESLPAYLKECILSLEHIDAIDSELYTNICQSIGELKERLDNASFKRENSQTENNKLKETEVLKEQLISIKNSISDR